MFMTPLVTDSNGTTRQMATGDGWGSAPAQFPFTTDANNIITAAALAGGLITSSGKTANRTFTTDTAALIAAAFPNMDIGDCMIVMVASLDGFSAIVAGGTGVTASGNLTVPLNSAKMFLLIRTGAATFNLIGL